jgi:HD-GYP domain-containing protein (c-di-GMP phosphodiesterase class II)
MPGTHDVVLELVRGHDAQVSEATPRHETEYLLRRGRGAFSSARFPWSETFLADLRALHDRAPSAQARQRVSNVLRAFLRSLDWSSVEAEILRALQATPEPREVRVTVRCKAAELCRLPLELLALEPSGEALGLKEGCHVQWEWPDTRTSARVLAAPPEGGALLFAWSTAGGPLDPADHLRPVQEVARRHRHPMGVKQVAGASVERLRQALDSARARGESVAVLHLLCHGGPLPEAEGGFGLWIDGAGDHEGPVDPATFAAALAPYAGLVGCVVLCACDGANLAGSANLLGSVAQRLHRTGFPAVVASRAPLSSRGAQSFTRAFYDALLSGEPVHRAVAAGRVQLGTEWPALQVYARANDGPQYPVVFRPYRGLRSFEESDRRFFFGREKLTKALLQRVREGAAGVRPRFQMVAGSSGSGKSSLVHAGLIPELRRTPWHIATFRPGGDGVIREKGLACLDRALRELRALRAQSPGASLLLVVDQLEEAFKLEGDEPQRFLSRLWRLAGDEDLRMVVLSTFRADWLERAEDMVLEDGVTLQSIIFRREHLLYVSKMSPEELLEAIQRPLEVVGLSFEPGLAEQLRDEAGREPGTLPLLEHAMDALWQAREGGVLTRAAHEGFGGLAGALTRQLDVLWDRLTAEQRRQGQRLLIALGDLAEEVTLSTRRRGLVEKLRPGDGEAAAAFDAVLEWLVDRRLLVRGQPEPEAGHGGWVEIAHEALIRRWTRLQDWLREGRAEQLLLRELEDVADAWEEARRDDKLLPFGGKLDAFEELERGAGSLPPIQTRCLAAARAASDKHHHGAQRSRSLLSLTGQISTQRDLDSALPLIVTHAASLVSADRCSLFILDRERGELWSNVGGHQVRLPVGSGIAGTVAQTGEAINIEDAYQDERFNRALDDATGYRTHTILAVPMLDSGGEVSGVLQALNKHWGTFDAEDESTLLSLGGIASSAIKTALLHDETKHLLEGFVSASVVAIESRDPTTAGHSTRVASMTVELARAVEHVTTGAYASTRFTPDQIRELRYASLLHDFGKLGVREEVLTKADKLSPHQMEALQARFQLARKDRELQSLHRRLAVAQQQGTAALHRANDQEDRELRAALVELDEVMEFVLACNRPTVPVPGGLERLSRLGLLTFQDTSGVVRPLITDDEVRLLSIPNGSLSPEERLEVESHITHTYRFLSQIPWTRSLRRVPEIAWSHHERLNGRGYPRALSAPEIPVQSKMMAIADIYDALTANSHFRKAVPHALALKVLEMEADAGYIDGELVRVFVEAEVPRRALSRLTG